jgi:nucleoid DNA-binding protein
MEEIIELLHKKYNLPKAAIRAICESPFKFVTENMRQRTLKTIQLKFFGKYAIHRLKRERYSKELERLKIQDAERDARRQTPRDIPRLEKPRIQRSRDREVS